MALFQNHVGFNITKSKLQLVEVNFNDNGFIIENVDEEFFPDFISPNDKETKLISVLRAAYNSLILKKPLNSNHISFLLPHDFFKVVNIPFDKTLLDKDLDEIIKWEFSILYPHLLVNDYIIQKIKVENSNLIKTNNVIFFALKKRFLNTLNKFAELNNLKLKFVDHVQLAANLIFINSTDFNKQQNSVSIYLTEESVHFMIYESTTPIYIKSFTYKYIFEIIDCIKDAFASVKELEIKSELIHKAYVFTDSVTDSIIDQIRTKLNLNLLKVSLFDDIPLSEELKNNEIIIRKIDNFAAPLGLALRLE